MRSLWKIAIGVPAVVFLVIGLIWLVAPGFAAAQLGMTLQNGVGLSTQIGDLSSFFLTMGLCMVIGLISNRPLWFYPPIMLLGFAASGRVLAWAVHGADLAVDMIAVEVLVVGLLYAVVNRYRSA